MSRGSRIAETFAALEAQGRMAFLPFLTAGDPDMASTSRLLRALAAQGADLIEIGFPYSDPIADGPVIQASYTRALARGLHVRDIFAGLAELRGEPLPPLVGMVSYSIIFRFGVERFLLLAADAGLAGLIVPDLPGDEARELARLMEDAGLDLIRLVAPTTPAARARQILETASGFVYCIAVAGTTGARSSVAEGLHDKLRALRAETKLPLAVGFGISRPEHVTSLRGVADGAIVGSALVRLLEPPDGGPLDVDQALERVSALAGEMAAAAHEAE